MDNLEKLIDEALEHEKKWKGATSILLYRKICPELARTLSLEMETGDVMLEALKMLRDEINKEYPNDIKCLISKNPAYVKMNKAIATADRIRGEK